MSISSAMSCMTVSAFGEDDMELDTALDKAFNGLQEHLNNSHCNTRSLAMLSDQDDDFKVAVEYQDAITDSIESMNDLFKEFQKILPQIVGKPGSTEDKVWHKSHKENRKLKKAQDKARLKAQPIQE